MRVSCDCRRDEVKQQIDWVVAEPIPDEFEQFDVFGLDQEEFEDVE